MINQIGKKTDRKIIPAGVGGEQVFPVHFTFWLYKRSASTQGGGEDGTASFCYRTDFLWFQSVQQTADFLLPQPYWLVLIFGLSLIFLLVLVREIHTSLFSKSVLCVLHV